MKIRVTTHWERRESGPFPSLRDDQHNLIGSVNTYLREKYSELTTFGSKPTVVASNIEPPANALNSFIEFLLTKRKARESIEQLLTLVDDALLAKYRNWAHARTKANRNSRGDLTARRTTNVNLRHIYHFLHWAQTNGVLAKGTLGRKDCKVASSLPDIDDHPHLRSSKEKFPLLFQGVGEGSRTALPQFWATTSHVNEAIEIFNRQPDVGAALRNNILALIGNHVGWRRASALSLHEEDFSDERMQAAMNAGDESFPVQPDSQKFSRVNFFGIPWPLAHRIKAYIDDPLYGPKAILKRLGLKPNFADGRIFLSSTTGHPLKGKTLSTIFSTVFRQIGAPKGAGYHALRRGTADEAMRIEIQSRIRDGRSTAHEDVVAAVSQRFGWASSLAYKTYMRVMSSFFSRSVESELRTEVAMLRIQLMDMGLKVRRLETERSVLLRAA
ncbi:hypothetical protein [Roseateles koreensis]|uniref:Tyr recombinase domain-containing protein n=1 Tax=Roseateles koreensis TaxID=2987526 RepID=A0ABT5KTQ2_9BURK|nr:hypothetical protein [Roseateles koreensis]MDC8786317.1 hypothetical protein [Roseateles koreensis]